MRGPAQSIERRTGRENERERVALFDRALVPLGREVHLVDDDVIEGAPDRRACRAVERLNHLGAAGAIARADVRAGEKSLWSSKNLG